MGADDLEGAETAVSTRLGLAPQLLDRVLRHFIKADGVEVLYPNGTIIGYGERPEELRVTLHANRAAWRVMTSPSMIGEEYLRGNLDITQPNESRLIPPIKRLVEIGYINGNVSTNPWHDRYRRLRARIDGFRDEGSDPAFHYDRGDALYELMLDDNLTYSCAYVPEDADSISLEEAQERKVDNILKKLQLEPGHSLLDIGSGWGHLLIKAAETYGVTGLGITLSKKQLAASRKLAKSRGVAGKVKFKLMDYKDLAESLKPRDAFDRVVSVGMFEHVGRGQHNDYFVALKKLLKDGGVTVLHTITQQVDRPANPWIRKYVFPGGHLPTVAGVQELAVRFGFRDPDVESRRRHYEWTLDRWGERLEKNEDRFKKLFRSGKIRHPIITDAEEAFRSECFYLASCAASFKEGPLGLTQFVFTNGIRNYGPLTRTHMTD